MHFRFSYLNILNEKKALFQANKNLRFSILIAIIICSSFHFLGDNSDEENKLLG